MDNIEIGQRIRAARLAKNLTQTQLGEALGVSGKAVSKWETGRGAPEVDSLPQLAKLLGLDLAALLEGQKEQERMNGNFKKMRFYVCPQCGNMMISAGAGEYSCCGHILQALQPQKPDEAHSVNIAVSDGDWFLTSTHEMTRQHFISFAAFLTGDTAIVKKCYPEWDFQVRIPRISHGIFLWYCKNHGLFYEIR